MTLISTYLESATNVAEQLLSSKAIQVNTKKPFTWSSGLMSPVYCDNRLLLSYVDIRTNIKNLLAQVITLYYPSCKYIAGVSTSGIPFGALVADVLNLPFIYVRTNKKNYGTTKQIEGRIEANQKTVVVEDLISTGTSSLTVAEVLTQAGMNTLGIVAIFSYGLPIATNNFSKAQIPLVCLSNFEHILNVAEEKKYLTQDDKLCIQSWQSNPNQWDIKKTT